MDPDQLLIHQSDAGVGNLVAALEEVDEGLRPKVVAPLNGEVTDLTGGHHPVQLLPQIGFALDPGQEGKQILQFLRGFLRWGRQGRGGMGRAHGVIGRLRQSPDLS